MPWAASWVTASFWASARDSLSVALVAEAAPVKVTWSAVTGSPFGTAMLTPVSVPSTIPTVRPIRSTLPRVMSIEAAWRSATDTSPEVR